MDNHIKIIIVDDDTISINGRTLVEKDALVEAMRSAVQDDPGLILVIEPKNAEDYKGIGRAIYASQHAGVPVANLRLTREDGEVVSFDALGTRKPAPPA